MQILRMAVAVGAIALAGTVFAQDRTAEKILAEFEAVQLPQYDASKRGEPGYVDEYLAARREAEQRRADLIKELYEVDPANPQIGRLMPQRWMILVRSLNEPDRAVEETAWIMDNSEDQALVVEAAYHHAEAIGGKHRYKAEEYLPAVEEFATIAPDDARIYRMLYNAANYGTEDEKLQRELYGRIIAGPDERLAGYCKGKMRQLDGLGKPFKLKFKEATTGEPIDMQDLRGKVVVVDFWATWCGPCVAEMPHMKELYAQYKDKGVEFIGVSLDQPEDKGGLEALRAYCKDNEITWPQYYQGNYWDSEFSTSWGINAIPCMFVVDQKGNLHSVKARGKLDEMIPHLLAQGGG